MESVGSCPSPFPSSSKLKFCIRIRPYMYSSPQTYIVRRLFQNFGVEVPRKIKFLLRNGDVFEGHYLGSKECLLGLNNLLRRYAEMSLSLLTFEYIGRGEFLVCVIASTAVEVEYPLVPIIVRREPIDYTTIQHVEAYENTEVFTMEDHLNNNLFSLNATDSSSLAIRIYMPHQYHEELQDCPVLEGVDERVTRMWVNFGSVYFKVFDKSWKVQVRRLAGKWHFVKGWPQFAADIGVQQSDLVVLSSTTLDLQLYFDVAIFRDYACTPISINQGAEGPQQFVKFLNERMIRTGEMLIPDTFSSKYDQDFEPDLTIVTSNAVSLFHVQYLKNADKLIGLGPFIAGINLEEGTCLIFSKLSPSLISVTVFDQDLVNIAL